MQEKMLQAKVENIIKAGKTFTLTVTGGGLESFSMLTRYGGMSQCFISGFIPYQFTGTETQKAMSVEYVKELLQKQANEHPNADFHVAVTAALYKENQRKGRQNRAILGIRNKNDAEIFFQCGQSVPWRITQEYNLSWNIVDLIERNVTNNLQKWQDHMIQIDYKKINEKSKDIYANYQKFGFYGDWDILNKPNLILYPGSFNPIHAAHRYIYDAVQENGKYICAYELNERPLHKLVVQNMKERLNWIFEEQIDANVILTQYTWMTDKVRNIRPFGLVMGEDTLARIEFFDLNILGEILEKIIIVKRGNVNKSFLLPDSAKEKISWLTLPEHLQNMSSTQLRQEKNL